MSRIIRPQGRPVITISIEMDKNGQCTMISIDNSVPNQPKPAQAIAIAQILSQLLTSTISSIIGPQKSMGENIDGESEETAKENSH